MPRYAHRTGARALYQISPPAAGANATTTVPPRTRWSVLSIEYGLTTAIAIATRDCYIEALRGPFAIYRPLSALTQAAGLAIDYTWMTGWPTHTAIGTTLFALPLGAELLLDAADVLNIVVNNIQPADQLTAVNIHVEEWIQP